MKVLKYFNLASPFFATQVNELYPEDQIGLVIPWILVLKIYLKVDLTLIRES